MNNIFPSLKQKPLKMLRNIFLTIIVQNLCSAKVKFQLVGRGYGAARWWHHALTNGGVGSVQQGIMRNAQFWSRIAYCTIGIVHNAHLELCTTRNPDCPRCTIGILCTKHNRRLTMRKSERSHNWDNEESSMGQWWTMGQVT